MVISMHLNYCTKYILVVKNVPRIRPSKTRIKFVEMCKLNFRFFYRIGPTCDGQCKGKYTSGSKAKQALEVFFGRRETYEIYNECRQFYTLWWRPLSLSSSFSFSLASSISIFSFLYLILSFYSTMHIHCEFQTNFLIFLNQHPSGVTWSSLNSHWSNLKTLK